MFYLFFEEICDENFKKILFMKIIALFLKNLNQLY